MHPKRVIIDRRVKVNVGEHREATYVGFDDVIGQLLPGLGERVQVFEINTGINGSGEIFSIDWKKKLLFITVDWSVVGPT